MPGQKINLEVISLTALQLTACNILKRLTIQGRFQQKSIEFSTLSQGGWV